MRKKRRNLFKELSLYQAGVADLPPVVADAYHLFQDLIQLVNADQPIWLQVADNCLPGFDPASRCGPAHLASGSG
jgi:hypothetical protein